MSLAASTIRLAKTIASRPQDGWDIRENADSEHWCVRRGWYEALLGPGSPDWFALERVPCATLVKRGHGRATYRVELGTHTVYAKLAQETGILDKAKSFVLGSPGEREWRLLTKAEVRGVPTVRSLGVAIRAGRAGQSVLVTECPSQAEKLTNAWAPSPESRNSPSAIGTTTPIIEAVARLYATAHGLGFVHGDGHPDNIILSKDQDGGITAMFVDVHPSSLSRQPACAPLCCLALAQLDQHFHRRATQTQRLRFLIAYVTLRWPYGAGSATPALIRQLAGRAAALRIACSAGLARHRDRRLRRDGKYFSSVAVGNGWKATVALILERRHVFAEPSVPDRSLDEWRRILEKTLLPGDESEPPTDSGLSVEIRRAGGVRERLTWALTGSPHRRSFERCHKLRHRDTPARLILGFAEHHSAGLIDKTALFRPDTSTSRAVLTVEETGASDGED